MSIFIAQSCLGDIKWVPLALRTDTSMNDLVLFKNNTAAQLGKVRAIFKERNTFDVGL